ncbi:Crp/Fnr family transcriptional regulator [Filimonas effusa]|uniref:Crp/Fnr family transcriptional regulator n=1 Tax=Filimonas effusa TaxID=2508721 RepID=A0A4Q1D6X1_9BACT|nr:Crp/Fnr family transcriptional regulator [Filimonas effusa]RXK83663.1 Crp/Fnr family transcriptional regulator [Filimonas effusa]
MSVYAQVSGLTLDQLSCVTTLVKCNEEELLERERDMIQSEFIVVEGVVRGFVLNERGDDLTLSFYQNGNAISPAIMRGVKGRSMYNLQVVSRYATILVFNCLKMERIMSYNTDLQQFGNAVIMFDSLRRVEKEVLLLKEPAKTKLAWFRKTYPGLENQIPHYFIASFLGITPTSLSRVRSKL